jgi:hypothetical protein
MKNRWKYTCYQCKEFSDRIDCIDIRTAEKWCKKNNITVHLDGRKKYVLNIDIERTLEMKYIDSLKERYPSRYKDVYCASKEQDMLSLYELTTTTSIESDDTYYSNETYDSIGEYSEDDFVIRFSKKI